MGMTGQQSQPIAEALASRGERIIAIGLNRDVTNLIGSKTRVVDLEGKLAVPGFNRLTHSFHRSRPFISAVGRSAVTRRP